MPMQTPQDLFVHELSDMLSAEQIIVQMLEEAQSLAQTPHLRDGLRMHAEQSRQHAQRVQQVLDQVGMAPHPVQCHAVRGLYQELRDAQMVQPSPPVLDGLVTGGVCKAEHLEIAAYTGLVNKARAMGMTEAAQLLQQNLQEEQQMLQKAEQIAQQLTHQMAMTAGASSQGASASAI
jgi:ferritin-like metal-binding protein YciE